MTTDLTTTSRQFIEVDRTGGVLSLDDEHRAAYVADVATGPVALIGDAPGGLERALDRAGTELRRLADLSELDHDTWSPRTIVLDPTEMPSEALVDALVDHAAQGTGVVLVVERPPGGDRSAAEILAAAVPDHATVVRHSVANASVFTSDLTDVSEISATLLGSTPTREVATHDIALVNVDAKLAAVAEIGLAIVDPEMLEELIETNAALRRENVRLAQARLGVHDAAAGRAAAASGKLGQLRDENDGLRHELENALESARVNDRLFQEARLLLFAANDREKELEIQLAHRTIYPKLVAKTLLARARNLLSPRS